MFKVTIRIDDSTDLTGTLCQFRSNCASSGISKAEVAALCNHVEHTVNEFAHSGTQLASIGSQLHIKRLLEGNEYTIAIEANFGKPRSLWVKIASLFGHK